MSVRPQNDYVLVESPPDASDQTSGGIIKPEGAIEDINIWGTVLAVGPGRLTKKGVRIPIDAKVGDRVLFVRFLKKTRTGEALVQVLGNNQFLIQEKDILAVDEEKAQLSN